MTIPTPNDEWHDFGKWKQKKNIIFQINYITIVCKCHEFNFSWRITHYCVFAILNLLSVSLCMYYGGEISSNMFVNSKENASEFLENIIVDHEQMIE